MKRRQNAERARVFGVGEPTLFRLPVKDRLRGGKRAARVDALARTHWAVLSDSVSGSKADHVRPVRIPTGLPAGSPARIPVQVNEPWPLKTPSTRAVKGRTSMHTRAISAVHASGSAATAGRLSRSFQAVGIELTSDSICVQLRRQPDSHGSECRVVGRRVRHQHSRSAGELNRRQVRGVNRARMRDRFASSTRGNEPVPFLAPRSERSRPVTSSRRHFGRRSSLPMFLTYASSSFFRCAPSSPF